MTAILQTAPDEGKKIKFAFEFKILSFRRRFKWLPRPDLLLMSSDDPNPKTQHTSHSTPTTMSSSSEPNSAPQQQQQHRMRKPPFADWPTIKILTPPQGKWSVTCIYDLIHKRSLVGRFSPKYDEWCFTYCSQTVSGRIHGREPNCRSLCIRKVFPHEIKNILSFKRHEAVGVDGKAKYPLPSEGQSDNLPRLLGGTPKEDSHQNAPSTSTRYWDEGWYLWTGNGRWVGQQKTEQMMLDLAKQQVLDNIRTDRKELWQEYQKQNINTQNGDEQPLPGAQWWGPLVPPKTFEDAGYVDSTIPYIFTC